MQVAEIMGQPAITCQFNDTLDNAAHKMWEYDCGSLPVVDGDNKVVGIITDRDICMSAHLKGALLREVPVSEAMTSQVCSCQASDSLETAEQLMKENQVRRIPVVDERGNVLGVLSMNDVARFAAKEPAADNVEHEFVTTIAAVCEPRARAPA